MTEVEIDMRIIAIIKELRLCYLEDCNEICDECIANRRELFVLRTELADIWANEAD